MVIKELNIKYFRHMNDVKIEFGKHLTIVSGLNGTGKSTVLGLAGHLFSYRYNKQGEKTRFPYKTISGKSYETEYSEIFRFCEEHDMTEKYMYNAVIDNNEIEDTVYAHSRYDDAEQRFRIYVGKSESEHGTKITNPVIYMGLNRLYPTPQEMDEKLSVNPTKLTVNESREFINIITNILASLDNAMASDNVITNHKNYEALKTDRYSVKGLSAGQDNISQIITAMLSFRRLPEKGGVLLIDELDTTLFPAAQINLLKQLYKFSKATNVQVVFTTHSLEIIKNLMDSGWDSEDWKINFLELRNNKVINTVNPTYSYIRSRILLETKQSEKIEPINILCEDDTAASWCRNLIKGNKYLKDCCIVYPGNFSCGAIADLASKKLACFNNFIFVIDGDRRADYQKIKNVVFIPGKKSPDSEIYYYLKSLPDDDKFWDNVEFFHKDTCFNGYINTDNEGQHKAWLSKNKKFFGRDMSCFFNSWIINNQVAREEFQNSLIKIIKKIH